MKKIIILLLSVGLIGILCFDVFLLVATKNKEKEIEKLEMKIKVSEIEKVNLDNYYQATIIENWKFAEDSLIDLRIIGFNSKFELSDIPEKFILFYSHKHCETCLKEAIEAILKISESITVETILLTDHLKLRDLKLFTTGLDIKMPAFILDPNFPNVLTNRFESPVIFHVKDHYIKRLMIIQQGKMDPVIKFFSFNNEK